jgi:hypothetical protein
VFYRAKQTFQRLWFNMNCRDILASGPLYSSSEQISLVSMVCHRDILMYLLAAKSFCRHLGVVPRFVVLNDGSLEHDDLDILRSHFRPIEIVRTEQIPAANTPKGNCWERLLLISDLVKDTYVVQLDSDTLTLNNIEEVEQRIRANQCFTLMGGGAHAGIEPMSSACEKAKHDGHTMVQAFCERSFDQLPECATLRYVRGNAGFVGFAKGSIDRQKVEWFSTLMRRIAGSKWDEWGSEQLTSNLLIANTEGACPLSNSRYLSFWSLPGIPYESASFIHFIGPRRYSNGLYVRSARRVIEDLAQAYKARN